MEKNTPRSIAAEVSIRELLGKILEKWYIIIATVLLFATSSAVYLNFFSTELYSSTAKLYIFNTEESKVQSTEFAISSYLVKDYSELITDHTVLQEVIDNLDLKFSCQALRGAISLNNPQGTRIIEVTAQVPDAVLSKKIADEVCKVAQGKIVDLMGVSRVNIISEGLVSKRPISPIKPKTVIGFATLGLFLSVTAVAIVYITSDKIYTENDIEEYLGLTVLSTIPYSNMNSVKKKTGAARRRKNGK
ncbi:MAG: Wzz/FepE/Etk N-terminal domain-containing protein [Oscillospiraceae bacterium]|nr:Wzz/FepE/Etk N-terminal domain-containing protein [Oscillospiraceae bacterium]